MSEVENFRTNLRLVRTEKGFDAANLSLSAGLNRRAVTDIEIGASKNPTLQTCVKVCNALGVDLSEMIAQQRPVLLPELAAYLSQISKKDQQTILAAIECLRSLTETSR